MRLTLNGEIMEKSNRGTIMELLNELKATAMKHAVIAGRLTYKAAGFLKNSMPLQAVP
jgi:hypothetical protein